MRRSVSGPKNAAGSRLASGAPATKVTSDDPSRFPGYSGEQSLEPIGWDEWFEKFDSKWLALVYQEATAGGQKSNFNKLVSREAKGRRTRATG